MGPRRALQAAVVVLLASCSATSTPVDPSTEGPDEGVGPNGTTSGDSGSATSTDTAGTTTTTDTATSGTLEIGCPPPMYTPELVHDEPPAPDAEVWYGVHYSICAEPGIEARGTYQVWWADAEDDGVYCLYTYTWSTATPRSPDDLYGCDAWECPWAFVLPDGYGVAVEDGTSLCAEHFQDAETMLWDYEACLGMGLTNGTPSYPMLYVGIPDCSRTPDAWFLSAHGDMHMVHETDGRRWAMTAATFPP